MGTHYLRLVFCPVSFSSINLLLRIVFFSTWNEDAKYSDIFIEKALSYFCSVFMIFV